MLYPLSYRRMFLRELHYYSTGMLQIARAKYVVLRRRILALVVGKSVESCGIKLKHEKNQKNAEKGVDN